MNDDRIDAITAAQVNQRVFGVLLALHGAVHGAGFLLGWRIAEPRGFDYDDIHPAAGTWPGRFVGLLWLVVGLAIIVIGVRLANVRHVDQRWLAAVLVASAALCASALPETLPGLVISSGILLAVAVLRLRRRHPPSATI